VFVTGRRQGEARVFVLNGATATFLQTFFSIGSYPDGTFLRGAGFDPVRKWVFAASESVDKVHVFDDSGASACP
jgi:DNA-binding beta-propeller fold protein YncE